MKEEFVKNLPQDIDIHLLGLQGSRMLGLQQSADADYDYRGVYVAKNSDLLSFDHKPKETIEGGSYGDDEMEYVFHEVEKFFRLAIKCNPSVIHLFFVSKFNIKTDIGDMIVSNKNLFINDEAVRSSFGGYALG
jgi:predicted nucleotidyltransferase